MHLRARRDGRPRSAVDLELPVMALLAILVGIGVVVWLNGQGAPDSGEIRRVTERPQLSSPREAVAAAEERRAAAAARARTRVRRVRAARVAQRRRAALAAAARRPYTGDERYSQYGSGYPATGTQPGYPPNGQTYTQQQVQPTPVPAPAPAQPKRSTGGGGGGGGQFDDSG
jgi:hypothetical protein